MISDVGDAERTFREARHDAPAFLRRLVRADGRHLALGPVDEGDALPVVMLDLAEHHDGTSGGPGFGSFGQPPDRCRPVGALRARARADLAPSADRQA
jgi:hypothetical protein